MFLLLFLLFLLSYLFPLLSNSFSPHLYTNPFPDQLNVISSTHYTRKAEEQLGWLVEPPSIAMECEQ